MMVYHNNVNVNAGAESTIEALLNNGKSGKLSGE